MISHLHWPHPRESRLCVQRSPCLSPRGLQTSAFNEGSTRGSDPRCREQGRRQPGQKDIPRGGGGGETSWQLRKECVWTGSGFAQRGTKRAQNLGHVSGSQREEGQGTESTSWIRRCDTEALGWWTGAFLLVDGEDGKVHWVKFLRAIRKSQVGQVLM